MTDLQGAFLCKCLAASQRARVAGRVRPADGYDLVAAWAEMADGDAEAAVAVLRFLAVAPVDPVAAGEALHAWIGGRPELSAETRVQIDGVPRALDDWRARADCGLGLD